VITVVDAAFKKSATKDGEEPDDGTPEIAFAGRSNVGKSSMINALLGRKKLVRVSNTPGRTRLLNFFDVTLSIDRDRRVSVRLCDLPGYGFAKVSKTERESWRHMIGNYLKRRKPLAAIVVIIDANVGATPDDVQMIDFAQETDARILVAATKIDKLGKSYRKPRLSQLARALDLPIDAVVGFSATQKLGIDDVWERLVPVVDAFASSR